MKYRPGRRWKHPPPTRAQEKRMNMEEQLTSDVYQGQCELARIRGEQPPPFDRAFKDRVMDIFLDQDFEPADEAEEFFANMVRRYAP